ncbi:MAG: OmpA family protein [Flavobacteriales bacterium]
MTSIQPVARLVGRLSAWVMLTVLILQGTVAHAQPAEGWAPDRHAVVLGADSDHVYVALGAPGLSLEDAIRDSWTVHSAPRLGGALVEEQLRPLNVEAWANLTGVQHVAMHPSGNLALISARREGDDLDLFLSHRRPSRVPGGRETWTAPLPLDGLNTEADEVFPHWEGRDVVFSSNRTGKFQLHTSRAVTQWLRAEARTDLPNLPMEVLSAVTVGPGWTWVSGRSSADEHVAVHRIQAPAPEAVLGAGWSLCLRIGDIPARDQDIAIREVASRNVVRQVNTGAEGCASIGDLPSGRAWTVQWLRGSVLPSPSVRALAEIRAPDGRVVRTYELRADRGWEFVFLPLDPITEIQDHRGQDGSTWPTSTLAILSYERGSPTPTSDSWRPFLTWAKGIQSFPEQGFLLVTGHTDASGTDDVNAALSRARAEYVATQLQALSKWPEGRVEVRALGSTQPLGDDPTQNRRVEVRWVPAMQ